MKRTFQIISVIGITVCLVGVMFILSGNGIIGWLLTPFGLLMLYWGMTRG